MLILHEQCVYGLVSCLWFFSTALVGCSILLTSKSIEYQGVKQSSFSPVYSQKLLSFSYSSPVLCCDLSLKIHCTTCLGCVCGAIPLYVKNRHSCRTADPAQSSFHLLEGSLFLVLHGYRLAHFISSNSTLTPQWDALSVCER